ncbi:MAG: HEAT repeat domain-containing protein [Chloroflexi bacterium]|nr:HEAT repeat domain-containing protein [Chloroflexota bacterium]
MADLRELVEKLKSNNPKQRRKACADIAKLKNPEAIPVLVRVYQTDPDEKVRQAAGKALETFRAMQPRERGGTSPLLRTLMLGLGGLLVLLVIGNIALSLIGDGGDDGGDERRDPGTLADRDTLLTSYTENIENMETSAAAIVEELSKVPQPDQSPDCSRSIDRPSAFDLTPIEAFTYPDLLAAFGPETVYRTNIDTLNTAYDDFRSDCRNMGVVEVIEITDRLTAVRDAVPGLLDTVNQLRFNPAPTRDPALFGQPTETPIPVPTATTVPTQVPGIDYATHVDEMLAIIDRQTPGLNTVEGRWLEVQEGTQPASCRVPEVSEDEDYELPEGQEGDVNIDASVVLISDALAILRENYSVFANQCPAANLAPFVDEALVDLADARAKLEEATLRLNAAAGRAAPEPEATPEGEATPES